MEINNNSKTRYLIPASILIAGILITISIIYSVGLKNYNVNNKEGNQANIKETVNDSLKLSKDDVVLGDNKAPITIIIYSDPSCPFCAAATGNNQEVIDYLKRNDPEWVAPLPKIKEDYVKSGKVKIVFRYFPGHGTGEVATKMMFCANEQNKFWDVHDKVFGNQNLLEDLEKLTGLVKETGVDISKIESCLNSGKYDSKLIRDTASGKSLEVKGTPAFFINGIKIEGAYPYSEFKKIIDQLLTSG